MEDTEVEAVIVISDSDDEDSKRKGSIKIQTKARKKPAETNANKTAKTAKKPLALSKAKNGQQSIVRYFKDKKSVVKEAAKSVDSTYTPTPSFGAIHPAISPPKPAVASTSKPIRKPKLCPAYKVVENTRFAVDAFQFGHISGVDHYFLTHFHADHYVGLRKSFAHPLHVSRITARLVREFIGIDEKYIHEHDINLPFFVDDVEVTALDANHCPGAVMFLFRLPAIGRCILHTGDFRASADMETYPAFWNHPIDTVYLDTTYLTAKGAFISQSASLTAAARAVHAFLQHDNNTPPGLIIVGTYLIGKEKVWMSLADSFDLTVWLEPSRRRALECIYPASHPIYARLVPDAAVAVVHVMPMQRLSYRQLCEYRDQLPDAGTGQRRILALRPSGWEKDTTHRLRPAAQLSMVGVEYSEHSSYEELSRFVRFLRPRLVIPTVPVGRDLCRTPKIPPQWLSDEVRPVRQAMQTNIRNFLVSNSK